MELVGVRNITINSSESSEITFEVVDGTILKVLSLTHSAPPNMHPENPFLKLNNEYLLYTNGDNQIKNNFPIYLPEGTHQLTINNYFPMSATLYTLEFKLTTP